MLGGGAKNAPPPSTNRVNMTQRWKESLDKGNVVGVLFLDFRKAFDAVSHDILMEKVKSYGINGALYDWIFDYLAERSHYTEVNGQISSGQTVKYGVPF